jgi:hypothetical protein
MSSEERVAAEKAARNARYASLVRARDRREARQELEELNRRLESWARVEERETGMVRQEARRQQEIYDRRIQNGWDPMRADVLRAQAGARTNGRYERMRFYRDL